MVLLLEVKNVCCLAVSTIPACTDRQTSFDNTYSALCIASRGKSQMFFNDYVDAFYTFKVSNSR